MADKIFISTTGCLSVRTDTSRLETYLRCNDYEITQNLEDASSVVLSTCVVTEEKENDSVSLMNQYLAADKKVVISGCGANALPSSFGRHCALIKSDEDVEKIFPPRSVSYSAVEYGGESVDFGYTPPYIHGVIEAYSTMESVLKRISWSLARNFRFSTMGFEFTEDSEPPSRIFVSSGCNYRCSYCIVWKGRGKNRSQPIASILSQMSREYKKGMREFIFVADELSSYGYDLIPRETVGSLVSAVVQRFPDVRLYLRYLEPMKLPKLWEVISEHISDNQIAYLNIPLQSGSQKILDRMNRPTKLNQLRPILEEIRQKYSGPLLTHMIVGAPYEHIDDIQESVRLLIDYEFDDVSIHLFSARPGASDSALNMHDQYREHFKVMDDARKLMRAKRFSKILPETPCDRSDDSTELEREFRFPMAEVPESLLSYLKRLRWSEIESQVDIVLMHPALDGFVARIRKANKLFLQFKTRKEEREWIETSVEIEKEEVKDILSVLREFLEPVVVVSKRRRSSLGEGELRFYQDDVDGIGPFVEIEGKDRTVDNFLVQHGLRPEEAAAPYGKILTSNNADFSAEIGRAISILSGAP